MIAVTRRAALVTVLLLAAPGMAVAQTPGPPGNLTVTVGGDGALTLQWTAPTTGGAPTAYLVQIGRSPGASDAFSEQTGNVTSLQVPAGTLADGTYYVRVRAVNSSGVSAASTEVVATIACTPPASPPTSLTWRASSSAAQITWVPVPAATSYRVEVGSAPGLADVAVATTDGTRTFAVIALPGPGTYYARVKGQRTCGDGPTSEEVTIVAAATEPATAVLVNEFSSFVELKNVSSDTVDVTGWRIHTSTGSAQTVVRAATLPAATIPPGCTYLLAVPNDVLLRGVTPDHPLLTAIVDGVALVRPDGRVVDAAGRENSFDRTTHPNTPYLEGGALPARRDSVGIESFARAADQDTNNNAADFVRLARANPQNRSGCLSNTPPGPPQNLTVAITGATVELSWSEPSSGGPPRLYRIEAGTSPGTSSAGVFDLAAPMTRVTFNGVPNGTFYIRLRAINDAGVSVATPEQVVVVCGPGCTTPPGAPTQLTVQVSGRNVLLQWRRPDGVAPTGYVVEAGTAPGLANLGQFPTGSTAEFVIVSSVPPGTYYVRVRGVREGTPGAASNEVLVVVP